ncbi:MAG: tetratricopeptide repeat protein [Planctomycetota bacterium]|jgi:tetratricopeptide (TPR) repeat protein
MDQPTRLSECPLWAILDAYYERLGVDAWRKGDIPSLASTNALVAETYADAILGYLTDLRAQLEPDSPVYVVELGAGSGRLGFLILKALERFEALHLLDGLPPIVYVLSDPVQGTLDFFRSHPPLVPFLESGKLAVARYKHTDGARLRLEPNGPTLTPNSQPNPIVGIANYVFDTLEQDAFRCREGELFESQVLLEGPTDPTSAEELKKLRLHFHDVKLNGPGYDDPDVQSVLEAYRTGMDQASFLIPIGAIRAVRSLRALAAGGEMLLLSADKGEARMESFEGIWDWSLTVHAGCFSFMVNYHALGLFAEAGGGRVFHAEDGRDGFRATALVMGAAASRKHGHLSKALSRALTGFGVGDFLAIAEAPTGPNIESARAMAHVRACAYDPYVFAAYEGALDDGLDSMSQGHRHTVRAILDRVQRLDFQLGDHLDLNFLVGRIRYKLSDYAEALQDYRRSLETVGPHEATHYNLGLCHEALGELELAVSAHERALERNPNYDLAKDRLARVRKKLEAGPQTPPQLTASGELT